MIKFDKENEKDYRVTVNGDYAGNLVFDEEQDAWVFDWGEDGTTYETDLEESKNELIDDFNDGQENGAITFGVYEY